MRWDIIGALIKGNDYKSVAEIGILEDEVVSLTN